MHFHFIFEAGYVTRTCTDWDEARKIAIDAAEKRQSSVVNIAWKSGGELERWAKIDERWRQVPEEWETRPGPRAVTELDYVERAFIAGDIAMLGVLSWVFNFGPWSFTFLFAAAQAALAGWHFVTRKPPA
jgi:hypothetical protein